MSAAFALCFSPSRAAMAMVAVEWLNKTVTSSSIYRPNESFSPPCITEPQQPKRLALAESLSLSFPLICSLCLSPRLLRRRFPEDHLRLNTFTVFLHNCVCACYSEYFQTHAVFISVFDASEFTLMSCNLPCDVCACVGSLSRGHERLSNTSIILFKNSCMCFSL